MTTRPTHCKRCNGLLLFSRDEYDEFLKCVCCGRIGAYVVKRSDPTEVYINTAPTEWTTDMDQELARLINRAKSWDAMARTLGVLVDRVRQRAQELGLKRHLDA